MRSLMTVVAPTPIRRICLRTSLSIRFSKLAGGGAGRKPGSVPLQTSCSGAVISLGRQLPDASCGTSGDGQRATHVSPRLAQDGVYRAGTSRCRWCALTAPLHPYLGRGATRGQPCDSSAVSFCGTILTLARTGRYPAIRLLGSPDFPQAGFPTRDRRATSSFSILRAAVPAD